MLIINLSHKPQTIFIPSCTTTFPLFSPKYITTEFQPNINFGQKTMSLNINDKRNQLRQEIRKKERWQFFMKERMKIQSNYLHQSPLVVLVNNLRNRYQLSETLIQISKIVSGVNYKTDIMKLIEEGFMHELMSLLSDRLFLKETIEIISFIVEKMVPEQHCFNIYEKFYNFGLLEYMIKFISDKELSSLCAFILYRYSEEEKEDYAEALAFGGGYKALIQCFMFRFSQSADPELQNQNEGNKFYSYIMSTLQNILLARDSALDLQENKLQIFNFAVDLIQKRCFLSMALGIFYEGLRVLGNHLAETHIGLINEFATNGHDNQKYYNNALVIVYQITPCMGVNYLGCLLNAVKTPKHNKIITLILLKMIKADVPQIRSQIPLDTVFWEKLMINQSDQEYTKRLIWMIGMLPLDKDMVWRFIASTLEMDSSNLQQFKGLEYVSHQILRTQKEPNLLFNLQKHRIPTLLEKLSSHSKIDTISKKATSLLDYILGPLTEIMERQS